MGEALADVLLGHAEPGGRLPVSMPAREADCPVLYAVPRGGQLCYDEGLLIGYRGYDAAGVAPHYPFGHGLGYTSWAYESLHAPQGNLARGDDLDLVVTVRNTGTRPGREIIQAYGAGPAIPRRCRCPRTASSGRLASPGRAGSRVPSAASPSWPPPGRGRAPRARHDAASLPECDPPLQHPRPAMLPGRHGSDSRDGR